MITQNRLHGCLTSQIGQFYYTTNKIKETNAYVSNVICFISMLVWEIQELWGRGVSATEWRADVSGSKVWGRVLSGGSNPQSGVSDLSGTVTLYKLKWITYQYLYKSS